MRFFKSFLVLFVPVLFSFSFSYGKSKLTAKEEKSIKKSQKAIWLAHVLRQKKAEKIIESLEVVQKKVPVFLIPQNKSFRPLVKLKLKLNMEGGKLFDITGDPIRYNKATGEYTLYAYLLSRVNTVNLIAKDDKGNKKTEKMFLFAPEAREFKTVSAFSSIQYSLGHTYLVYDQSTFGRYVSQSLLIGARYTSPEKGKKIGYFADASSTIYTYESSPIERSAQFLEARLGLSYAKKIFKTERIRSRFMFGVSSINLFSLGGNLGFKGLFGPNLGLKSELYTSGRNSFSLELQYTPYELKDPVGERSLKASLEWNRNLNNMRNVQFGLSYSDNTFEDSAGSGVEKITARVLSAYVSLSF